MSRTMALNAALESGLDVNSIGFRGIAETSPDLIEVLDPHGRRIYLNPACTLLHPDPGSMLGTSPLDDPHLARNDKIRNMLTEVMQQGTPAHSDFHVATKPGEIRHFECLAQPVMTAGKLSAVVLTSRDITGQARHRKLLNRYETQMKVAEEISMLGSWEYDFATQISMVSEHFAEMFGLPPGTQQISLERLYDYIHPDDHERLITLRNEFLHNDIYEVQYRIVRPDSAIRVIRTRWKVELDDAGQPARSIGICKDITDKLTAERSALTLAEHFQLLVENAHDFAVFLLDLEGFVTSWNMGAQRVLGYSAEEIIGRHYSCLYPFEPTNSLAHAKQLEAAALTGKHEATGWRIRKDQDSFWAHAIITRLQDKSGKHIGYLKIIHDMTKQKCIEDLLRSQTDRLKANARRLVELQETERQHLARELHDMVGPNLTALGINLQLITNHVTQGSGGNISEVLKDSVAYLHSTVDTLRYIIGELRPLAFDDFGLRPGLRSHVTNFTKLTGIRVNIEETNAPEQVPDFIKLSLFRITQEALNNIAKHSRATMVDISIVYERHKIGFSIRDNGIGFDKDKWDKDNPSQGVGLLIIQERAEAIGAGFILETAVGKGVQIYLDCFI